uniref:Putative terminase n=1 Tax=viral metagenome TaxID=1070528 RepID=A0A6M3LG42_9ZZZZ
MIDVVEKLKPELSTPFPNIPDTWKCTKTGLIVPKHEIENIEYRHQVLRDAEYDKGFQNDLMAASAESLLFWVNTFCWTFHQFDVFGDTGERYQSEEVHCPFISWEIQDILFERLIWHLANAKDILINKSRDMGASWICTIFLHWLWLFRPDSQLLELSRTEPYVDQAGNMKALFQKHDYINAWLPEWMVPPHCGVGQKYRTKMHLYNILNGSCIDGESTTEHAASGDRRLVALLDEFAKVKHGRLMRSATRDAALMRIVNSTVAGPGTEYSKWKNDGTIIVFPLMWWEHPEKGFNRRVDQDPVTNAWKIRSPWYDVEDTVRSPQEMAREIDADDLEAGSTFFTATNIDKHIAIFGKPPKSQWDVNLAKGVPNDDIPMILKKKDLKKIAYKRVINGKLKIWTNLIDGRPDQNLDYIIGFDLSKGQGASNSVGSIKCRQTGEKIGEWVDANTPPYEMARVAMALALWIGGRKKLPFLKWEMNGDPGYDFGKIVVKQFHYPYYYRDVKVGNVRDKKTKRYGWHNHKDSKGELLNAYDRALAHGGYINHSIPALEEAKTYIYNDDGSIGPACLVEESSAAKKTHGDRTMADALTIEDKYYKMRSHKESSESRNDMRTAAGRKEALKRKRTKPKGWRSSFDFRK